MISKSYDKIVIGLYVIDLVEQHVDHHADTENFNLGVSRNTNLVEQYIMKQLRALDDYDDLYDELTNGWYYESGSESFGEYLYDNFVYGKYRWNIVDGQIFAGLLPFPLIDLVVDSIFKDELETAESQIDDLLDWIWANVTPVSDIPC